MSIKTFYHHYLILVLILITANTYCQNLESENDTTTQVPFFTQDFLSGYRAGVKLVSAPFSFDEEDWLITGSVMTAITIAYLLDKDDRSFWQKNHSTTLDRTADVGKFYGEITNAALISGSLYLGGKIIGNKNIGVTSRILLEGLFFTGLTTTLIKTIAGRSRPYAEEGYNRFKLFQTETAHTSFPSGHVTVAFTLSTILSSIINNDYATIGLYALAASTVMQRLYSDNHWLSDTVLSASIGYFIGKAVVKFDDNSNENDLCVNAYYIPTGVGVSFLYSLH